MYGWAKLMAEMTLRAYYKDWGMKSACCRYFTVYGPRGVENHAVIAMIARAYIGQDPFVVWGTGEQIRNWTYVDDIVEGTIRTGERIDDGSGINLGTMERTRVIDAVHMILDILGREPRIELHPEMPTGPSIAWRTIRWARRSSAGSLRSASGEGSAGPSTGTLLPGINRTLRSPCSTFSSKGAKAKPSLDPPALALRVRRSGSAKVCCRRGYRRELMSPEPPRVLESVGYRRLRNRFPRRLATAPSRPGLGITVLLCLGCSAPLRSQGLDAYGGALSLQCGPNTKAVTSAISTVARASGTVTLTFSSPHRFIVNDTITVGGTTADGGSFNTPGGQLFTVTSVPSSTAVTYRQSGDDFNPTSDTGAAQLPRYYVSKVGNRWWLCTPLGNAMWMNAVAHAARDSTTDYQNIKNSQLVLAKYAKGITTSGVDNWAYQTALRLTTWGFNVLGEYSDWSIFPSNVDPAWSTPDQTMPSQGRMAFIFEPNPIIYSAFNRDNYAPGPTKCELGVYKRSVYRGALRAMVDIFDPNFSSWLVGVLANGLIHGWLTGPHHEYLLAFVGDESDTTGGLALGPDFQPVIGGGTSKPGTTVLLTGNDRTDPHWGWITLISSPVQAAASKLNTPEGRAPNDLVYADVKFYTKSELASWLQQSGDRGPGYASIAALNAAWGSKYDTFGSDAQTYTETCATGNGATGPYTCTLKNAPVTPLSVQVKVGDALHAGDDAAGVEAKTPTATGNFRSSSGTQPIGSITYSSGSVSITFSSPVPTGTPITVAYQTNGWGQGRGLLDEDGTCPSRGPGQGCWLPANPYWTAHSAENQIQKDLDGFLFHFMKSYFATVKGDIQAAAPGYLYFPVDPIGSYACPPHREVLEAAALYTDVLPFGSIPASDPTGVVTDQQARIDFVAQYAGDLPWVNINFLAAQADSYFPASQFPLTYTLTFSTQLGRGQYYQAKTNAQLGTTISAGCNCGFAGTHPIVGQSWWNLYDDASQKTDFGLLTLRDDPYDGVASTPNPGVDPWGYPTGCQGNAALPGPTTPCEQGSYGDALDSIIGANSAWLTHAVSGKDFRISAAPVSASVSPGMSATFAVTLTPLGGLEGTLQVTCEAPSGLTESMCTVSPASVTVSGSSAATVTVRVSTTAASRAPGAHRMPMVPGGKPLLTPLPWLALLVALGLGGALPSTHREGRRRRAWMLPAATALALLLWASCGGGAGNQPAQRDPGTPAGTYSLTLSAQGGNATHTVTLTLRVQ